MFFSRLRQPQMLKPGWRVMREQDYKARIREAILPDLPDHDTLYNAPGQIGDGRLDGGRSLKGDRALKLAAVLVPVVDYENEPKILLTRRADHLKQHSGRWRSPAARSKPRTVVRCRRLARGARRDRVGRRICGCCGFLSTYETGSGFRILPVVGFVRPGFQLEIDHNEVAETSRCRWSS